ncbi:hypothetical protein B0A55_13253 [Friedmanniomyces simplex]|uniref:Uncharacterized protein n=1 Tax=Friedmanniomyces simplex TaxID=329884 RepID=A0A4V5NAS8_9PEZI|nr:hypothetical protein B0A55_13253 [Friedmanniomyces simplex]
MTDYTPTTISTLPSLPPPLATLLPPTQDLGTNPPPPLSMNPLQDLEKLSQALSASLQRLADWYERSGTPFARRRAARLRGEERRGVGSSVEVKGRWEWCK